MVDFYIKELKTLYDDWTLSFIRLNFHVSALNFPQMTSEIGEEKVQQAANCAG